MQLKEILSNLTRLSGVSGDEFEVGSAAAQLLSEFGKSKADTDTGCVFCQAFEYDKSRPCILLEAHIDEIGMIVTYITDDGFLKVSGCGGLDSRVLLAQEVTIYGRQRLTGIVTSTPPHLEKDSSSAPDVSDIYIDTGLTGERARELISLGDRVLIENTLCDLQNDRVTSKALDDRCGMAAIIRALQLVKESGSDKKLKANVMVLFSSQEEVGERGAKVGAYQLSPDMAVVVDVSFAKTHYESAEDCGALGLGPMIGIAPSLNRKMSEQMIRLAKENDIPYQIEVMSGKTGTDADAVGITGEGVKTVTLSVAQKHMHTPVEIVDLNDVENTAKLLAKFLESVQ